MPKPAMLRAFKKLPQKLGQKKRQRNVLTTKARQVRTKPQASYVKIKEQVLEAISKLPALWRNALPADATLPELIVGFCLAKLQYWFQAQRSVGGGRLFLGGSIVDYIVLVTNPPTIVRVQGSYFHSLPERKLKDALQFDRLQAKGYRVADIWEYDLYREWAAGRAVRFVEESVKGAL